MDRYLNQRSTPDWQITQHLEGGRGTKVPDPANQIWPGDVVRFIPTTDLVSTTGW